MMISNAFGEGTGLAAMFSTHPAVGDRIAALVDHAGGNAYSEIRRAQIRRVQPQPASFLAGARSLTPNTSRTNAARSQFGQRSAPPGCAAMRQHG